MQLYGFPLSNYYNMVKHVLIEKELEFTEVYTRPSQEDKFLLSSPMGKIPVLQTSEGFLTETDCILDYLEESYPIPALFPTDPFPRAKMRQIMKVQELYVETSVHRLIGVIFGRDVPVELVEASEPQIHRGLKALSSLLDQKSLLEGAWLCGDKLTAADILVFYSFALSNYITKLVYNWNILESVPGLATWYVQMSEIDVSAQLLMEHTEAVQALEAKRRLMNP
jgi:glutathione S-transferase